MFLLTVRIMLGRVVRRREPERVLVLGDDNLAKRFVDVVSVKGCGEYVVVGVLSLVRDAEGINRQLHDAMQETRPDRVVVGTEPSKSTTSKSSTNCLARATSEPFASNASVAPSNTSSS